MFFSILISDPPIVAHSQLEGEGRSIWCKLRILTSQEAARKLLSQLAPKEAQALSNHLPFLKETDSEPSVEVEGKIAASLSGLIVMYYSNFGRYQHIPQAEELMGFWRPLDEGVLGAGIIMWSDLYVNYHATIVHSKEQAEQLIGGFHWLQPAHQASLLGKIKKWNVQQYSVKPEQRINGILAELLCRASIVAKVVR